jgi:hypothetical protein
MPGGPLSDLGRVAPLTGWAPLRPARCGIFSGTAPVISTRPKFQSLPGGSVTRALPVPTWGWSCDVRTWAWAIDGVNRPVG